MNSTNTFQTPVVLIAFNRPQTTRKVFEAIAAIRPAKLLLIADGPRASKEGEKDLCTQVRTIIKSVDWPCELLTNFSDQNLGCRERVVTGLNWVFSLVEEAIILEDDCLPHPSFFQFCQEMLKRYRGDSRIGMISGNSFVEAGSDWPFSYYFSRAFHIWGWATWRTAWQRYDPDITSWPEAKKYGMLSEFVDESRYIRHWTEVLDKMYAGTGPNTWDFQWAYTNMANNTLSIVPTVNLVENIGFGPEATHTIDPHTDPRMSGDAIEFPLNHPATVFPLRSLDRRDRKIGLPFALPHRVVRKMLRISKP